MTEKQTRTKYKNKNRVWPTVAQTKQTNTQRETNQQKHEKHNKNKKTRSGGGHTLQGHLQVARSRSSDLRDAQPRGDSFADLDFASKLKQVEDTAKEFMNKATGADFDNLDTNAEDPPSEVARTDEEQMWKGFAHNGLDPRSSIGQRFARDPALGKSAEYQALGSNLAKAAFRKRWAAEQFAACIARREKENVYEKLDMSKGVWLPFTRIVQKEGGDEAAVSAAENYIKSCMMKGWVKTNRMTQRTEYLYLKSEIHESFMSRWRELEVEETTTTKTTHTAAVTNTSMPALKGGKQMTTPPPTQEPMATPSPKPKLAKEKTALDKATSNACATKRMFCSVYSQGKRVNDNIASKGEWNWAAGSRLSNELKQLLDDIDRIANEDFASKFLSAQVVRSMYTPEVLLRNLLELSSSLDEPLSRLARLHRKLLAMHRENGRDD